MRVVTILLLVTTACSSANGPARTTVTFDLGARRVIYHVEVADSDAERAHGLMGRRSMPRDAGMLFTWPDVASHDFYMKDTLIPLDLIEIRAGRVVGIDHLTPCPPATADCPTTPTPPVDAALELNAGQAASDGITVGALVASTALA
jgi:uncharacterized protein